MFKVNQFDEMLTGNPQITYFKNVYRRHTYFFKFLHESVKNYFYCRTELCKNSS